VSSDGAQQLAAYFREASSWDEERLDAYRASVRRAWQVAAAGAVCALACTCALVFLLPLKRVEPFVIRVDNATGVVDVVPVYAGRTPLPQAVSRYFLTHYVRVCERFDYATAPSDYEECGAFHTARGNQAWYALWNRSNPASPLNLHQDGSSVSVQVESVSFFSRAATGAAGPGLAQVRYLTIEHPAGTAIPGRIGRWIATVQYTYTAPSADVRVRGWNPLGFKVIEFVREPEVLRDAPPPDAAGAATGAPPAARP
jgi:type IV secretion system protein VirB8